MDFFSFFFFFQTTQGNNHHQIIDIKQQFLSTGENGRNPSLTHSLAMPISRLARLKHPNNNSTRLHQQTRSVRDVSQRVPEAATFEETQVGFCFF